MKNYIIGIAALILLLANTVFLIISYIKLPKNIRKLYAGRPIIDKEERSQIFDESVKHSILHAYIAEFASMPIAGGLCFLSFGEQVIELEFTPLLIAILLIIGATLVLGLFFSFIYEAYLYIRYFVCTKSVRYFWSTRTVSPAEVFFLGTLLLGLLEAPTLMLFARIFGLF